MSLRGFLTAQTRTYGPEFAKATVNKWLNALDDMEQVGSRGEKIMIASLKEGINKFLTEDLEQADAISLGL